MNNPGQMTLVPYSGPLPASRETAAAIPLANINGNIRLRYSLLARMSVIGAVSLGISCFPSSIKSGPSG